MNMGETLQKEVTMLQLIIAVISSGFLTSIGTGYFTTKKNSDQIISDQYREIIATTISELDKAKIRISILETKNQELFQINTTQAAEIKQLRRDFYLLESQSANIPIAEWTKDLNYRMLSINNYYEKMFLLPRGLSAEDYIGQMDSIIWGVEVAKHFIQHDQAVIEERKALRFIEVVPDGKGGHQTLFVVKYPRMVGGVPLGIGGAAIVLDDWLEQYLKTKSDK